MQDEKEDQLKSEPIGAEQKTTASEEPEVARHRLAAIVESSDDAIIGKTLEGIIISWNKGAERIFGYTAEEVVGKHISILIPPDHFNEEPEILAKIGRGERVDHYETVRLKKGGEQIHISLTVSPIRDASGKIVGASKIARDITERKEVEKERARLLIREQEARKQAEEANRLKDEFLLTISHELRTPLTSMLGWIRMLGSSKLDPATTVKAIETIERNIKSQAQLIEDLLDISRIVTGKLRLDVRQVELENVISAAVDAIRPATHARNIKLRMAIDSNAQVSGDFERLQQVVWNLLSNAVKFTPKGGRVEIRLDRIGSSAEITVTDTGQGIKAEFLPYIFNRFTQADSSTTRKQGGLGVGLSIVKKIVEMHGGTVEVASEGEGRGATFTVKLPAIDSKRVSNKRKDLQVEIPGNKLLNFPTVLNGLRILVVDDDVDTCEILKAIFEQVGAEVNLAFNVDEAIEILEAWRPAVLVSDIGMPGENGYDLIRRVRAREASKGGDIQAVALTAFARIEDRMKALAAGYQMHVPKPVEPTELVSVIASLTGLNQKD